MCQMQANMYIFCNFFLKFWYAFVPSDFTRKFPLTAKACNIRQKYVRTEEENSVVWPLLLMCSQKTSGGVEKNIEKRKRKDTSQSQHDIFGKDARSKGKHLINSIGFCRMPKTALQSTYYVVVLVLLQLIAGMASSVHTCCTYTYDA